MALLQSPRLSDSPGLPRQLGLRVLETCCAPTGEAAIALTELMQPESLFRPVHAHLTHGPGKVGVKLN